MSPPTDTPPAPAPDVDTLDIPRPTPVDPLPGKPARRPRARKASTGDKPTAPRRGRPARAASVDIAGRMADLYVMAGGVVSVIPSAPAVGALSETGLTITQLVGLKVAEQAGPVGEAWAKLAEDNAQVRDALERFLSVSVFAELVAAHMPMLVVAAR